MHICIFRRRFTPWGVDGTMVINGKFFCGTLERPKGYLKADAYRLALVPVTNPKFLRDDEKSRIMPVILKENGRVQKSVIRKPFFVPGNGPYKLMYGSIILGRSYISGLVLHSEEYFSEFCEKVDEAIRNREHITLVIRDWGFDAIPLKYLSPFKSSVKSLSCVR